MKKKMITYLNLSLFAVEIYRTVEHIVVCVAIFYGNKFLYDLIELLWYPLLLISFRDRVIISFMITVILWIEKKFLLDKFKAAGVSEEMCIRIKKFCTLSKINTVLFVYFAISAMN